jgi:tRNA(Ile)-lysidine synthase
MAFPNGGHFHLMTTDFIHRFRAFSETHQLLTKGDHILAAVSGGADSVALLFLLLDVVSDLELTIGIAHVNHGLRGKAADRDNQFVNKLADNHQLPFYSVQEDVHSYAKQRKLSIEEAAREVRYLFLEKVRSSNRYDSIALGHHAGDKAETVLINLVRGTGIRGMSGIRPKNNHLIRPLLFAERREIEAFLRNRGQKWMTDSTNRDVRFLRNRIRRSFLMPIESIRPGTISTIGRTADSLAEIDEFLYSESQRVRPFVSQRLSNDEIILDINPFLHYFTAVRKAVLFRILEEFDYRMHASDAVAILDLAERRRSGAKLEFDSLRVICSGGALVFYRSFPELGSIPVLPNESVALPNGFGSLVTELLDNKFQKDQDANPCVEYLDYDRIKGPMAVRSIHPGDWFIPLGMTGKKKLQDFFIDEHVPNYRRGTIPILTSGEEILWVVGHRIDDRFKLTPTTHRVLKVRYSPMDSD